MIDLRREVRPIIMAMRERKVEVGRVFPALPNFIARYYRYQAADGNLCFGLS